MKKKEGRKEEKKERKKYVCVKNIHFSWIERRSDWFKVNKKTVVCCHSTTVKHREILDSYVYRKQDWSREKKEEEEEKSVVDTHSTWPIQGDLPSRTLLCYLQVIASCSYPPFFFSSSSSSFSLLFVCYYSTESKSNSSTRHYIWRNFLFYSFSFFLKKKKTMSTTEDTKEDENAFCIYIYIWIRETQA